MTSRQNSPVPRSRFLPCSLAAALVLSSCGPCPTAAPGRSVRPSADEFSVMTYNLGRYGLADRDGDGQKDEEKPPREREAVIGLIAEARPDVLAVQEMGDPEVFREFRSALEKAGLPYDHAEFIQRGRSENNLAILSRYPIVSRQAHTNDAYSIGPAQLSVLRGFADVEIEVRPGYRFRLMAAHLKSKVYHRLGQTEMRRNEARLLNNHVRKILKEDPEANLLVVGDLNDTYQSAALHEAMGERTRLLRDLRPKDAVGDVWTHFGAFLDQYDRIDYILASPGMEAELVPEKTRVIRDPRTYEASDHRPVLAVFRKQDGEIREPSLQPEETAEPAEE